MEVFLAVDLKGGVVVHGRGGAREHYRPLDWGLSPSAEPESYITSIAPRNVYLADLDRIERRGDQRDIISKIARRVDRSLADRGVRSATEISPIPGVTEVIGTETAGTDLEELGRYPGGYLSLDIRNGSVIPGEIDPLHLLQEAEDLPFEGCIILNLDGVGGGRGLLDGAGRLRDAYQGTLLYGGGIASEEDLYRLADAGFDGAIVATAVHRGTIPVETVRAGKIC